MRAQTTLDFAIGIAIFLGVLLFVFSFVPGILAPFELPDDEGPALSDRIGTSLSKGMLGSAEQPHVLDRVCTVEFFNGSSPSECNYSGTTLEERFNLSSIQHVNVTLEGNVTGAGTQQLCWEGEKGDPSVVERGTCDESKAKNVVLTAGDRAPQDRGTTITTRRVVSLDGESVTLRVVVW
jgi:hypothetical protein